MPLTTIGVDRAFAEQRIVGWHRLHLGDHGLALRIATHSRRNRLQVMR